MRKVLLFALLAAITASPVHAQGAARDFFAGLLYDVDSLTLTYCTTTGPVSPNKLIKTTGVSATLEPYTASSAPFAGMAAGDVLSIRTAQGTYAYRVITTYTSENAVTVDSTIDLTATGGFSFTWYRNTCGTGATAGWFSVPTGAQRLGITSSFQQGDITGLAVRWECKTAVDNAIVVLYPGEGADCGPGGTLSATYTCDFLAATAGTYQGQLGVVDDAPTLIACRVGLAIQAAGADASDAGANREKISAGVAIR